MANRARSAGPLLIAHRGASAYRPEHTLAAYTLAIEQGADFIEPDLQITKDGRLIAMHDVTLDRTTNAREVFPDRYREEASREGGTVRRWYAIDFTLEEIRRLDAGSWFGEPFKGARVPTLEEVIDLARGKAGIFPETKAPDSYADRGFKMERLLLDELERHGLDEPGVDPATPVRIQSFSAESLRILRHDLGSDLPLTFLLSGAGAAEWLTEEGLRRIQGFASGVGPTRSLLTNDPAAVARAHAHDLSVIPWTFGATEASDYDRLRTELRYFLCTLGVDGLFINNPDLFPREPC